MSWVEVFVALFVSHHVGDYVLQTEWQATHKHGGLSSDPIARRALLLHVATYTIAFIPALVWLADGLGAWILAIAALIGVPHLIQDDGRLLEAYARAVKHFDPARNQGLVAHVDQSLHITALFLVALLADALAG